MTQLTTHKVEWGGKSFLIDAHPESLIGRRIENDGIYESWLLQHIAEQEYDGVAIDVGACIGTHTLWFAGICGLPVVAFEPLFRDELSHNVRDMNPQLAPAVRIENSALGDKATWAHDMKQRVLTDPEADLERAAQGKLEMGGGSIPVNTLDSYDLHNVSLIKIDVEGLEPEVLRGADETIRRELPDLYIEAKTEDDHKALEEVLGPHNYVKTARWKRGTPIEKWEAK